MTITYTIPGATLLNQRSEPTMDGLPDENANDNCVPASIAEALHILTGRTFDGDELKDAVYGQGWTGFQSASAYVAYCAAQGVDLAAHNDTQAGLIATLHAEVSAGHPVLVTMPSMWGTAPADPVHPTGSTHVGVAVGVGAGEIRVMNPWGGFWQDQPDSWWQARLCYGQVWPLQKKAGAAMSGVPSGWSDDGTTLRAPNGVPVVHGIRAFVLANSWDAADVPLAPEDPSANPVEVGNPSLGAGARQFFKMSGQVSWTQAMNTFRTWNGQEELALHQAFDAESAALAQAQQQAQAAQANVTAMQQQRDALSAQLATAQAQLQSAQGALAHADAQTQQDQQTIAQLQQQVAALQNAPAPTPQPAQPTPQEQAAMLVVKAIQQALAIS